MSRDERTKKAQWVNVRSLFLEKLRIKGASENGWDPLSSREGWGKKSSRREILSRGPVSVVWIFSSWPKNRKEVGQIIEARDAVEWCDKKWYWPRASPGLVTRQGSTKREKLPFFCPYTSHIYPSSFTGCVCMCVLMLSGKIEVIAKLREVCLWSISDQTKITD